MPFLYTCEQWLPLAPEKLFPFFSDATNLERITPPFLKFAVVTPPPIDMKVGTLIDYKLRVHGIPLKWKSRITLWEPPYRFIDEQIRGPYKLWHHEHTFVEQDHGTLARDIVHYDVPGGWLVNKFFVRRDIENIFTHRRKVLDALFASGKLPDNNAPPSGDRVPVSQG